MFPEQQHYWPCVCVQWDQKQNSKLEFNVARRAYSVVLCSEVLYVLTRKAVFHPCRGLVGACGMLPASAQLRQERG